MKWKDVLKGIGITAAIGGIGLGAAGGVALTGAGVYGAIMLSPYAHLLDRLLPSPDPTPPTPEPPVPGPDPGPPGPVEPEPTRPPEDRRTKGRQSTISTKTSSRPFNTQQFLLEANRKI